MKNVQMRINPELYAQFKRVDGETNDERMDKLMADSKEKYKLIELVNHQRLNIEAWRSLYKDNERSTKYLSSVLVASIAVSVCSVAYVCVVNGWFS